MKLTIANETFTVQKIWMDNTFRNDPPWGSDEPKLRVWFCAHIEVPTTREVEEVKRFWETMHRIGQISRPLSDRQLGEIAWQRFTVLEFCPELLIENEYICKIED